MTAMHVFIAQLPPGEDPYDVARRDPERLKRIIAEAKPAGVWGRRYLAAHPEFFDEHPNLRLVPEQRRGRGGVAL